MAVGYNRNDYFSLIWLLGNTYVLVEDFTVALLLQWQEKGP